MEDGMSNMRKNDQLMVEKVWLLIKLYKHVWKVDLISFGIHWR